MTKELIEFLNKYINEEMIRIILSGSKKKDGPTKTQIRPVLLKGQVKYQLTDTVGPKELHSNYDKEPLLVEIEKRITEDYKQMQYEGKRVHATILVSKKGKITIKVKEIKGKEREDFVPILTHNRQKKYLIQEGKPIPYLVDLGVMGEDGKIKKARYAKFKQLNRYLEFIEDILPKLPSDREVNIIDFGCGKSYLTFAMYHYLREVRGYDVNIIGLDLKTDVIEKCSNLARKYGYDKLHFLQGDIASYEGCSQVDMVVTLHACDTATDYALLKAVRWGAKVILSVPCCQHELNGQIKNEMLAPIMEYGILKERFAALLTDGLRAQMLESVGYDTQILEFIDIEHTPKNLLIRAVKNEKKTMDIEKNKRWLKCEAAFAAQPTLEKLLFEKEESDK